MSTQSPKRYWIDDLGRKHEAYHYDDAGARIVTVEHEGRSLRLLVPESVPLTAIRVTASVGDLLFLIGEQLDEEDEDGYVIEGGDGVVMVARRHPEKDDTFWLFVWHNVFPETLRVSGLKDS